MTPEQERIAEEIARKLHLTGMTTKSMEQIQEIRAIVERAETRTQLTTSTSRR